MNDTDHYGIYKSEVAGVAMTKLALRLSLSDERRDKLHVFSNLESAVLKRYLDWVAQRDERVTYPWGSHIGGLVGGLVFGLMPWKFAMKMLASGTAPFIKEFQTLLDGSSELDREFFQYVLNHELAITEFAQRELASEKDSTLPMERLISG